MPSPTSRTRPTSRASSLERYWSISVCRTETISSALNLITASRDQLVSDTLEAGADGAVVEPIADADHQPAEEVRIDLRSQERFAVQRVAELPAQALALVLGQGHGGPDLDPDAPGALVAQLAGGGQDRPQQVQAL